MKTKNIYNKFNYLYNKDLNQKNTKIYLSEKENKYLELKEVNNTKTKYDNIINNSSFYEIPELLIAKYEKKYHWEKIVKIIREIEKEKFFNKISVTKNNYYYYQYNKHTNNIINNNDYFSEEYDFYGNKNLISYEYGYFWNKLISKNSIINELSTSPIKELISTNPEHINVNQKICFPLSKIFEIYNPDLEDNLVIKDIKTDIHQVKIFPYFGSGDDDKNSNKINMSSDINSYFPYIIHPQSKFSVQLLILPDAIGKITGNLYIKFNDKKVLIIPITIEGVENEYKIKPIYKMNWQIKKKLAIPIKVTNPSKKKLHLVTRQVN